MYFPGLCLPLQVKNTPFYFSTTMYSNQKYSSLWRRASKASGKLGQRGPGQKRRDQSSPRRGQGRGAGGRETAPQAWGGVWKASRGPHHCSNTQKAVCGASRENCGGGSAREILKGSLGIGIPTPSGRLIGSAGAGQHLLGHRS